MSYARKYNEFQDRGAEITAICVDTPEQNKAMIAKLILPFHILSDPEGDRAIKPYGVWFIADINAAPTFEEQLTSAQTPMLYAMSVLSCMSSSLSEPGGAGLGTLGLPEPAMRTLVEAAGFTRFRRVDLPHPINAFYEARP